MPLVYLEAKKLPVTTGRGKSQLHPNWSVVSVTSFKTLGTNFSLFKSEFLLLENEDK